MGDHFLAERAEKTRAVVRSHCEMEKYRLYTQNPVFEPTRWEVIQRFQNPLEDPRTPVHDDLFITCRRSTGPFIEARPRQISFHSTNAICNADGERKISRQVPTHCGKSSLLRSRVQPYRGPRSDVYPISSIPRL
jgi:hypothetical protein